jgi:uncharacterized protein (DUF885 family)
MGTASHAVSPAVAAGADAPPAQDKVSSVPIPVGDRPFEVLAADLLAAEFAACPALGSALGLVEYDEELADLSPEGIERREANEDSWTDRFLALDDDALDADERVDRDLVLMVLAGRRVMRDWQAWRRDADAYAGEARSGIHIIVLHRLRPEPDLARAVIARLRRIPDLLAQGAANLDPRLANPLLLRRSLGQIGAGADYLRGIVGEFADESLRRAVAKHVEAAAKAMDEFGAVVEALADQATGGWAIGEDRYDGLLRHAEGLSYGAREMRQRGQAAYSELAGQMRRRSVELGGGEDWRALVRRLAADRPQTPAQMRQAYADITARAQSFCREHDLVTFAEGEECEVVPSAPFTRSWLAVAHYIAPPPFAPGNRRRAGHFFVPYPPADASDEQVAGRLATNAHYIMPSMTAHEAYPGHHWHLSWMAANQRRPLRYAFSSAYFTEGWALYAEEMMREQGFFADPRHELGQVDARLFRAARIVVDTSLHLGEMSVADAIEHLSTKASLSPETARAEVLRYCAWPTQAASYLTGALEVQRMRDEWLHQARGSLKDFHDRVAETGRLPINLVEQCLFA